MRVVIALTLALIAASCSQWDQAVEIPFEAAWQGEPLDCGGETTQLTDLRFFVSKPQLIDADGRAWDLRFATEYEWQSDSVALIDLESGNGGCTNGTQVVFDRIIGVIKAREYRGLRFTIGVPFRQNHANPLLAGAPLDDPAMHWHWRSGYKFLRAGIATADDGFWIHLGSAGCEGTVGHITDCRFPNRVEVFLPGFVPGESRVTLDLSALLDGTDLTNAEASDCSSGPPEEACAAPFATLGIDFATGELSGRQRVFSVQ